MNNLILKSIAGQRGFTLIELIVSIAVAGILSSGVAMLIFQTVNTNSSSKAQMTAVKQVESAVHWINRDTQQAQKVEPQSLPDFLKLTWVSWNDNVTHQVTYTQSDQKLVRRYYVNEGLQNEMIIASSIDFNSSETNCSYDAATHKLSLKISSNPVFGNKQANETRICQIIARPGS